MNSKDIKIKALELIERHIHHTNNWTNTGHLEGQVRYAVFESGMKLGRAKQCAIISAQEVLDYAKTFGDVTYDDQRFWEAVIIEITNYKI